MSHRFRTRWRCSRISTHLPRDHWSKTMCTRRQLRWSGKCSRTRSGKSRRRSKRPTRDSLQCLSLIPNMVALLFGLKVWLSELTRPTKQCRTSISFLNHRVQERPTKNTKNSKCNSINSLLCKPSKHGKMRSRISLRTPQRSTKSSTSKCSPGPTTELRKCHSRFFRVLCLRGQKRMAYSKAISTVTCIRSSPKLLTGKRYQHLAIATFLIRLQSCMLEKSSFVSQGRVWCWLFATTTTLSTWSTRTSKPCLVTIFNTLRRQLILVSSVITGDRPSTTSFTTVDVSAKMSSPMFRCSKTTSRRFRMSLRRSLPHASPTSKRRSTCLLPSLPSKRTRSRFAKRT